MTAERLKTLASQVEIDTRYGAKLPYEQQDEWQRSATGWHCTLSYQGRQYSFDFWQGSAISREPDVEGCLDCLLSDAQGGLQTFEDFCGEFGYDTDSRKAERVHKACQRTAKRMKQLLGDDFEAFLYADRN